MTLFTRRAMLMAGAGTAALAMLPTGLLAQEEADNAALAEEMIEEFTGGAEVTEGDGVRLTAPEIAENGNTVPISVNAPGASAVLLLAMGNPTPGIARFNFGELAGSQSASTRIRLAETQDVVAIAQMADGGFVRTAANIKVTIGGCGG